jgi:hypothetical protein
MILSTNLFGNMLFDQDCFDSTVTFYYKHNNIFAPLPLLPQSLIHNHFLLSMRGLECLPVSVDLEEFGVRSDVFRLWPSIKSFHR